MKAFDSYQAWIETNPKAFILLVAGCIFVGMILGAWARGAGGY